MNWYKKAQSKYVLAKYKKAISKTINLFLKEIRSVHNLWNTLMARVSGKKISQKQLDFAKKETKRILANILKTSFLTSIMVLPAGIGIAYALSKLIKKYTGININPEFIKNEASK